jgi:multidrug transporter EmrE-like cation transporter
LFGINSRFHFLFSFPNTRFLILALFILNFLFNVISNSSFKLSAQSANWRWFIFWQIVGNLAGFITVLTLTALLRYLPLNITLPITMGLTIIGVQVLSSNLFFHEKISPTQWLGTLFIVVGIIFVSRK